MPPSSFDLMRFTSRCAEPEPTVFLFSQAKVADLQEAIHAKSTYSRTRIICSSFAQSPFK